MHATMQRLLHRSFAQHMGAAVLLDSQGKVLLVSAEANAVVGALQVGVSLSSQLCGFSEQRPIAEALVRQRAAEANVERLTADGKLNLIRVVADPIEDQTQLLGWLVRFFRSSGTSSDPDLVERWGIATKDSAMKHLLEQLDKVAPTDVHVLVRGETGSGKEVIARAIHDASSRRSGPFRAINCAALPASLLESELFGHVRGAFTGAVRDSKGHFRSAHRGTLFLDEIGEMPLDIQAKLLRVVQEKSVIPVGGSQAIDVDVRIISATHRSLRQAVEEGNFRADLMYRLRVVPLFIPPLRQRRADIDLLSERFVEEANQRSLRRQVRHIAEDARSKLRAYSWPGNVRELINAIEYAFVMGEGEYLKEADLPPEVRGVSSMDESMNRALSMQSSYPDESQRLLRALERAGGHHGRAAAALGINRTTLWRRLKKLGLQPDSER